MGPLYGFGPQYLAHLLRYLVHFDPSKLLAGKSSSELVDGQQHGLVSKSYVGIP